MEINKSMKYNKSITATVYVINDGKVLLHQHKKYKTGFLSEDILKRMNFHMKLLSGK